MNEIDRRLTQVKTPKANNQGSENDENNGEPKIEELALQKSISKIQLLTIEFNRKKNKKKHQRVGSNK